MGGINREKAKDSVAESIKVDKKEEPKVSESELFDQIIDTYNKMITKKLQKKLAKEITTNQLGDLFNIMKQHECPCYSK